MLLDTENNTFTHTILVDQSNNKNGSVGFTEDTQTADGVKPLGTYLLKYKILDNSIDSKKTVNVITTGSDIIDGLGLGRNALLENGIKFTDDDFVYRLRKFLMNVVVIFLLKIKGDNPKVRRYLREDCNYGPLVKDIRRVIKQRDHETLKKLMSGYLFFSIKNGNHLNTIQINDVPSLTDEDIQDKLSGVMSDHFRSQFSSEEEMVEGMRNGFLYCDNYDSDLSNVRSII